MFIFNTTFHVEGEVMEDSLSFFRKVYIPEVLESGEMRNPRLAYIHRQNDEEGHSLSLQFEVTDVETLNSWLQTNGHVLQQKLVKQFGSKVAGFNTLLEEIEIGE